MAMNIPPITFGSFKDVPHDHNLKERYWKFLFDNLQRAVDELYMTCETDENVLQCKEVAMVLERCTKDFHALIERFKLLHEFEQADSGRKPSSLAWEVRPKFDQIPPVPIPKASEMSPRRSAGGRLSKRTLFSVSCIPPASNNLSQLPTANTLEAVPLAVNSVEAVSVEINASVSAVEDSSASLTKPLVINVSNASTAEKSQPLNNENKLQDSEDGEWRLVKTNKKGRILRKLESLESAPPQAEPITPIQVPASLIVASDGREPLKTGIPEKEEKEKLEELASFQPDDQPLPRSRTSTLSNSDQRKQKHSLPAFFADCDIDMDLSIELDEALISALTAEDELNNELREELNRDDQEDFTDDQSDSWLSASADSVRIPGRGVELHEKLLSPARRNKSEKLPGDGNGRAALAEQLAEKQLKVMELREHRQKEKIERCALLSKRVEEVRSWKNELMQEKKRAIESKMKAAEQRRLNQLQQIVKKAHDEEAKGSEIAFINNIEAESRKQEIQAKYQLWRKRLLELADEQNKRSEVTAARKSAASDRKRALDLEKQLRKLELLEKQKERERKAEQMQEIKLQERVAFCRAREKEHEERMTQLRIANESRTQELRERIYHKQDECARRYSELIEHRRERAVALSTQNLPSPRNAVAPITKQSSNPTTASTPLLIDQRKFCTACLVVLDSDLVLAEHLKRNQHRQLCAIPKSSHDIFCLASMQSIVPLSITQQQQLSTSSNSSQNVVNQKLTTSLSETPNENNRQPQKKRAKKYRNRLSVPLPREDGQIVSDQSGRLGNVISDLERLISSLNSHQALSDRLLAVERLVLEMVRLTEKQSPKEKKDFHLKLSPAFSVLTKVLAKYLPLQFSIDSSFPTNKSKTIAANCENSDRLITAILQCFIAMLHVNPESSIHLLCFESTSIPAVFEMLMGGVEALSLAAVSSLRLGGPLFDVLHSKLVMAINWTVCLFTVLSVVLASAKGVNKINNIDTKEIAQRCMDCVSLLVAMGFIDRTAQLVAVATYLTEFGDNSACTFLKALVNLLTASCRLANACQIVVDKAEETLLFIASLRFTDLSGIVSLVYALMLKESGLGKPTSSGEQQFATEIPKQAAELILPAYQFLTAAAVLDPVLLQTTLAGDSPLLLQFRQASAYIISQASACNLTSAHLELVDQVVICIGLFSLHNHPIAESVLSSGQPPTILQQLCQLPIKYFTDPDLKTVLIPTLLVISFKCEPCLAFLKAELSPFLLVQFLQEQIEKSLSNSALSTACNFSRPPFSTRFPPPCWKEALDWFMSSSSNT